jgi:hypothetical protein
MSEFGGLLLFAVVVGLVIAASIAISYSLYICIVRRPREPMANLV